MEGSQRTTTRICHLYSSTKKQEKQKQKRYNFMTENLSPTIHDIALSSLWLQPVGKPVALVPERKQELYLQEN